MSKFKRGDKVVPKKKSLFSALEFSNTWKNAQKSMQPYLYVIDVLAKSGGTYYTCDETPEGNGHFFLESDLIPYEEQPVKTQEHEEAVQMTYKCTVCGDSDPCYLQFAPCPKKPSLCPFVEKHYPNWHPVDRGETPEALVESEGPEASEGHKTIWYTLPALRPESKEPDYKGFFEFVMQNVRHLPACSECRIPKYFCKSHISIGCTGVQLFFAECKFIKRKRNISENKS